VIRQVPVPGQLNTGTETPLAGADTAGSIPGPGRSALAAALSGAYGRSPPRFGTPPLRPLSPTVAGAAYVSGQHIALDNSLDIRSGQAALNTLHHAPIEDPEVVRRHLVHQHTPDESEDHPMLGQGREVVRESSKASATHELKHSGSKDDEEFSSLRLQGGDITRQIYRWAEESDVQSQLAGRGKRSQSFGILRTLPRNDTMDASAIKAPGGFRRNYLRRAAPRSPSTEDWGESGDHHEHQSQFGRNPKPVTTSFLEFLTLYGHFAGEELEEDDEALEPGDYFSSDIYRERGYFDEESDDGEQGPSEASALLTPRTPGGRRRIWKPRANTGQASALDAGLLLLKSFVGTGVLFLPRAYLNGGMLFSNLVLLGVASLSYYCFCLLINTRAKIEGSFGDIGDVLYGKLMRNLILASLVLSQVGFVAAYIVFTSENLQAFILAVSKCVTWIEIKYLVMMQLVIFIPLSFFRDISKLAWTALVADFFILLGLLYLYYYDIATLANHGVSDIVMFNPRDWTLFIGTAIFTFEGVGLIIPIQEAMKEPSKFPLVLAVVMVIITTVFISMGALSYAAYGSSTRTVVLLNLPQDSKFVNAVQLLYSLAILLSTPLQLFPAIRILENGIFTRSGKYNAWIKWQKNIFRTFLTIGCGLIAWGGAGDLDKFVALVGSFACVPLVYIYPVSYFNILTFIETNKAFQAMLHYKAVAKTRRWKIADIALGIFGLVGMVYTTTLTIMNWATSTGQKSPGFCDKLKPA
jgi:proton-coupled amino acid transporter